MSPTEFSNYIKQRAMQQQIHHHHHHHLPQQQQHQNGGLPVSQSSPNSRSLSPGLIGSTQQQPQQSQQQQHSDPSAYFFQHGPSYQFPQRNLIDSSNHGGYLHSDLYSSAKFPSSYLDPSAIGQQFYGGGGGGSGVNGGASQGSGGLGPIGSGSAGGAGSATSSQPSADKGALVDNLNNMVGLGSVAYPASQYQHLLVAN